MALLRMVERNSPVDSLCDTLGRNFGAVLFDMDGTLVDTEVHTDGAIEQVLAEYGFEDAELAPEFTGGCTWESISRSLFAKYPGLDQHISSTKLEADLIERWGELARTMLSEIPGAFNAVRDARQHMEVGVVSGSPRDLVDQLLTQLGVDTWVASHARFGGDCVKESKPSPEGFLQCAAALGVAPVHCLVFEDSISGLRAARAAGATSVAVLHSCKDVALCTELADHTISHFASLQSGFWERISRA